MREVVKNCGISDFGIVDVSRFPIREVGGAKRLDFTIKSAIVAIFPYYSGENGGNISLYARGADYHSVLLGKLNNVIDALKEKYPKNSFVAFADNSPFDEVYLATLGGLGKRGENNLLLTREHGSYVFIGEIVSDLGLYNKTKDIVSDLDGYDKPTDNVSNLGEYDKPIDDVSDLRGYDKSKGSVSDLEGYDKPTDDVNNLEGYDKPTAENLCNHCGACVASCPTSALKMEECGAVRYDKNRCLSHLTQKKGELLEWEEGAIAKAPLIWGCDTCQTACPKNRGAKICKIPEFYENLVCDYTEIDITNKEFKERFGNRAFAWRGKGVLVRNILTKGKENGII